MTLSTILFGATLLLSTSTFAQNNVACNVKCSKMTQQTSGVGVHNFPDINLTNVTFTQCQQVTRDTSDDLLRDICPNKPQLQNGFQTQSTSLNCTFTWKRIRITESRPYSCF